jgi:hypothetical protein
MGTSATVLNHLCDWLNQGLWGISKVTIVEWIGIAGFALGVCNFISSRRRARRDPHRQEVLSIISKLRGLCEDASQEIARHLCFHSGRKSKEDIYRILKAAERELTALENRIPVRAPEIFKGYTQWYKVATGDGFPVEKKSASFKNTDGRVTATSDACAEFVETLDRLRMDCLSDKVGYW